MPSTPLELFGAAGLTPSGVVPWGVSIPVQKSGVYVVSLCRDASSCAGTIATCPIWSSAIENWLTACPALTLDGTRPATAELQARISEFWIPDEVVVYIGLAGTSLRNRVGQYYRTPLGAPKPHAGGHFLKTLSNLTNLYVHYAPADDPDACEGAMLKAFCGHISPTAKSKLRDPMRPFPFANLEYPPGTRKRHGLSGTRSA